jgi:hypothetical protein
VETAMNLNYFHCLRQVPLSQPEAMKELDRDFMSQMSPEEQLALLKDYAEHEKYASAIKVVKPENVKVQPLITKIEYQRPVRTINKFSWAVTAICAAALLLMIVYVRLAPPVPSEVATISDSMDAEWSSDMPISSGTRMTSNSKPIRLTRGIVKLQTDDQVQVVLEAPTEFYFKSSSEISMNYGRLFANVSKTGLGFSVVTPNSKIVDLGTEFGVLSHVNGNTEVHMYQGKANLFAGEKNKPKLSQLLTAGSARKVDSRDSSIQEIILDERALVRNIDSKSKFVWKGQNVIRLTDLLLGGNGFGTAVKQGIGFDMMTGSITDNGEIWYRPGPKNLVHVAESPYLDSIFVPGSAGGNNQISSAGHRFLECPKTSGLFFTNISCLRNWTFYQPLQQTFEQTQKQFPNPAALYMHSNIGLTVDLNAVRREVPGLRLSSFSTFAGILVMGANPPDYAEADVWVLVDGQLRASRKGLRADQGYDIHVELSDKDRFLSLAVTDGGKVYVEGSPANHFDTCGFIEPVFGLTMLQE